MEHILEPDWKYLRSIEEEMLEELSRRINEEVRRVLGKTDISEYEKRGEIFGIVTERDKVVAECFDDWRRSKIIERCWALRRHGLLKEEHLNRLDPETRRRILVLEKI